MLSAIGTSTAGNHLRVFADRMAQARAYLPEYRSALLWLLKDLCLSFPWPMIKLTAFSMLGASLQGAVLVGAIKYVGFLERDADITFAGLSFAARTDSVFILAIAAFFLLLALSAGLLYLGGTVTARLVAQYQAHLLKRALALFGTVVPDAAAPKTPSEALQIISKTIIKDAQKMSMIVRFLGSTLPSLIIFIYAFPILIYIDLSLTIMLIGVVGLLLPFFYQANIMAYRSDLMSKRSGSGATQKLVSLMEEIKDFQYISQKQVNTINKTFDKGPLKEKLNFLPVYLLSLARTEFWTNILLCLAVSLVIVLQVPGALAGKNPWSMLIAYIMFLRLAVNSFKSSMSFLTKVSRFYPYIYRYQHFVQSAQSGPKGDQPVVIKAAAHGMAERNSEVEISEPLLMALITGVPLSRYSFPYMVKLGTKADNGIFVSPQECFFIGSRGLPQRDGSLRSMLNLPAEFAPKDLAAAMPRDVYEAVRKHIGTDLDKNAGENKWEQLSLAHRVELGAVAAMLNPAQVVIIDENTLSRIPEARRSEVLNQLKQHKALTIVSYPEESLKDEAPGQKFGEQLCAVAGCTGNLLALGTPRWAEQNREPIMELLVKEQARLKKGMEGDGGDYDDEDE